MKKMSRLISCILAITLLAVLFSGCGGTTDQNKPDGSGSKSEPVKKVTLKLAHDNPATTPNGQSVHYWADSVSAASNGTLEIVVYDSEALGASSEGLTMMDNGMIDIQVQSSGMYPGKFPYLDAFCMPMLGIQSCAQGAEVFYDIYEQYPEVFADELSDYILLNFFATPAGIIGSDREIRTPDDLKAMNIRCSTTDLFPYLTQFGANPILLGASEIYTSFEKGVINGYCFEWGGVATFSLDEITPYYLDMGLFVNNFCYWMRRDVYESLPEDAKAAIQQYSGREGSVYLAENYLQPEADQMIATVDPAKVLVPDEENLAAFTAGAESTWKAWGDAHPSDVIDGNDFVALIRETAAKYNAK